MAERSDDTAFRDRAWFPKRRGAALPAALQSLWLRRQPRRVHRCSSVVFLCIATGWGGLDVAYTTHVPRMYLAFTSQSPPKHMAFTWLVPPMHHACTWLWAALHGFSAFFILPSAFFPGWPWPKCYLWCVPGVYTASVRCVSHDSPRLPEPAWLMELRLWWCVSKRDASPLHNPKCRLPGLPAVDEPEAKPNACKLIL